MPPSDASPSGEISSSDAAPPDHAEHALRRLRRFARWSDDVFRIPGTGVRIGLEPLIGLLPGVGDAAGLIVATYVPFQAWRLDAPGRLIGRMALNIGIDAVLGTVPLLGDVFDVTWKANRRNVQLLEDHLRATRRDVDPPSASRALEDE